MRNTATGFLLGYAAVGLLIAPALLCVLGVTPSYTGGIEMAIKRMDVVGAPERPLQQAFEFLDHAMWAADDFLRREVGPYLPSRD
jgi:hypothetical protein